MIKRLLLLSILASLVARADTPPPVNGFKLKYGSSTGLVNLSSGTASALSCGSNTGYLATWNGSAFACAAPPAGGVTSVGLALPSSVFGISGSPVTSTGTLTGAFNTQAANQAFMGPVGGVPGTPGFRSFVAADIPSIPSSKLSDLGSANGAASLDSAGKVPVSQLPASVMEFQGVWNATTNSPSLADGVGNLGDVYRVNVAGTQNLGSGAQTFVVGDWVVYDSADHWVLAHGGADAVQSVNSKTGAITLTTTDIGEGSNQYFTTGRAQAAITGTAPIQVSSGVVSCITATGSVAGCLSAADWTTFNGKQAALGFTPVTNARTVSTTAPLSGGGALSGDLTLTCIAATGSVAGCLSAADWTTFNNKQSALTFSAPLVNTTGTVSCTTASDSVTGCMSAADHTSLTSDTALAHSAVTLSAFGSTPNSNGASLSTQALTLQPADGTNPGGVSTTTQTFAGAKTLSGATTLSAAGALSTPALLVSGAPVTGGSATTTKPLVNIETSGAVTTNWNTSGTMLGVNAPSGFAGNLLDLQVNGANGVSVDSSGLLNLKNSTETVKIGTTSTTRFTMNNSTHSTSTFFTYAINTGALGFGVGTFSNDFMFSFDGGGTATYSAANVTATTVPLINIRNTNNTTNNFEGINFSSNSDNTVAWIAAQNVTQTTNSEDGRLIIGTTSGGTRSDKIKIEPKGQLSYGGTAPTPGSCGTSPSMVSPSNDNAGKLTVGTSPSTSCGMSFAATWANAPVCMFENQTTGEVLLGTPSTTAVTLTRIGGGSFGAADVIKYHCVGTF